MQVCLDQIHWPKNCLTTVWRQLDDCLTTAWRLPDDCLMIAWQLPNDCLITAQRMPDDCQLTTGRLPDDCPTTAQLLLDNYLIITLWLSTSFLATKSFKSWISLKQQQQENYRLKICETNVRTLFSSLNSLDSPITEKLKRTHSREP